MPRVKYENTFFQTFGDLPTIGSHAPDVSLVNTKLQNVTLATWTGMRKVMNIFVSIDRPVCATSVTKFDQFFPDFVIHTLPFRGGFDFVDVINFFKWFSDWLFIQLVHVERNDLFHDLINFVAFHTAYGMSNLAADL